MWKFTLRAAGAMLLVVMGLSLGACVACGGTGPETRQPPYGEVLQGPS